jgi:outer membrane receptor protein involved in Fe transport
MVSGEIELKAEMYERVGGIGARSNLTQKGTNYYPSLNARYNISNTEQVNLNYNGGVRQPSLEQLQPVPDFTDSLNIYTGNPDLKPEINNSLIARYSNNNVSTGRDIILSLSSNWAYNKIANHTQLTGSRRVTTPINVNGSYSITGMANVNETFIKKVLRGGVYIRGDMNKNISIVNGRIQELTNYSLSPSMKLTAFVEKIYEGSLTYQYRYNTVENTLRKNNTNVIHTIMHEGTISFPLEIRASYYINYINNSGLAKNLQQEFLLTNISLEKSFLKPKGWIIRLSSFDIFNNYPTVQRNIGDNYYEDVSVNRLGRYLMLSVIYKFTSFPKGQ